MIKASKQRKNLDTEGNVILKRLSPLKYFLYSIPLLCMLSFLGAADINLGLLGLPLVIVLWICVSRRANDITETKWRYLLIFLGLLMPFILWFFPTFNKQEPMQEQQEQMNIDNTFEPEKPLSHVKEWME